MNQSQDSNDLSGAWLEAIDGSAGFAALEEGDDYVPQRYGFKVGGLGFLLAEEKLSEVVMDYVVHPIPNTQQWFIGMINMRGNLVPVFDIRMLLGINTENDASEERKLLLLDSAEKAVSILIDDLPVTISLDQHDDQLPNMPDMLDEHIGKVFRDHGQAWVEIDMEAFFQKVGSMASAELCV